MNDKPIIIIGNGIRGNKPLLDFLCSQNMPILTTWMAADLIPENHPSFCGRPGIFGQRAANIIQQKATDIRCFGVRLDGEQVAYDYGRFASNAKRKSFVDSDIAECARMKAYGWDVSVIDLSKELQPPYDDPYNLDGSWLSWCKDLYNRFRPELNGEQTDSRFVNPFFFTSLLSYHSKPDDIFAIGSSGNAPTVFMQSYKVKEGQRISNVSTIGAMGADIPMALGACLATGKRTICVTGDGGFQMNAQELETIRRLHLPIIFFIMSNGGYNSIRVGQLARFGRVTGANPATGFTMASIENLASCYGFMYHKLDGNNLGGFEKCFTATPMIVEVIVDPEWQQLPRVMASGSPSDLKIDNMENMTPYLDDLERIMSE